MKEKRAVREPVLKEQTRQWTVGEIPVMTAEVTLPHWEDVKGSHSARRLERYYCACRRAFLFYCDRYLYPQAAAEFEAACRCGTPLPHLQARLECTITRKGGDILSLYTDCTEWAGTRRSVTMRRGDTWDLRTGDPITARECFPRSARVRKQCLDAARAQSVSQMRAGVSAYAPNLSRRLRRFLNLRDFYLTPTHFCFFYQPYTIAGGAEGCPVFTIPLEDDFLSGDETSVTP